MSTELIPAIDIRNGMIVRLLKGDYNRMIIYGDVPWEMANIFDEFGAERVHVVDLDGAREGCINTAKAVKSIINKTHLKVQVGGGIREEYQIVDYLNMGADRVILGTMALTDLAFTENMIKKYGESIVIGLDIKDGYAAIKGWEESSGYTKDQAFRTCCDMGAETIICTDISKDGAMSGVEIDFYQDLIDKYTKEYGCRIISSGGVTDINDIVQLAQLDLDGIIVGRAIYDGKIDIFEAVEVCKAGGALDWED